MNDRMGILDTLFGAWRVGEPSIIPCTTAAGERPPTIADVGVEHIINRRILQWGARYGSYGMGGPGFFGLQLESAGQWPAEYLVLTLWSASEWLLLDGSWIDARPRYNGKQGPMFSYSGPDGTWDDVTPRVVGGTIEQFDVRDDCCKLHVLNGGQRHVIELPRDTSRLPPFGNGSRRRWQRGEKTSGAWVVCDGNLYC